MSTDPGVKQNKEKSIKYDILTVSYDLENIQKT